MISLFGKSETLAGRYNLTIEMETGVGKTYTYIKTMYELNKQYGWSKFIIVVPSIAIREGVYKSFQVTQEHFAEEYGKKIRFFIYNSKQLPEIDRFASDSIYNMIYRLDAMDAYNKRLVKKIAVKGITESGSTATDSFVYLESINLSKAAPTATIQFDFKGVNGIRKRTQTVHIGFNLYDNSGLLDEYKNGFVVKSIDGRDEEYMKYLESIPAGRTHAGYFSIDKKRPHDQQQAFR